MATEAKTLPEYRHPWVKLAEADLTFANKTNVGGSNYSCAFSRAILKDRDLQQKSEVENVTDNMDDLNVKEECEEGEIMEVEESPVKEAESKSPVKEAESKSPVKEAESKSPVKEAESGERKRKKAGLRAEFPKGFKSPGGKYYRNPKTIDNPLVWLHKTTFEDYWEHTKEYLIYATFVIAHKDSLTEEEKASIEELSVSKKPDPSFMPLLKQHTMPFLMKSYSGLTNDYPEMNAMSKEERYEKQCVIVMERTKEEFQSSWSYVAKKRCQSFINKIQDMGFVGGFSDKDLPSAAEEAVEEFYDPLEDMEDQAAEEKNGEPAEDTKDKAAEKKKDEPAVEMKEEAAEEMKVEEIAVEGGDHAPVEVPNPKKRFPVVYGDDETFSGVTYDIFDPHLANKRLRFGEKHARDEAKPSVSADSGIDSAMECTSAEHVDFANVNFHYDPDTEAYLDAKKAKDYYKDDPEIRKYYYQRYRLFSRLDEGVIMDREGWFSVTPERIAEHIADRIVIRHGMVVVDAFAGVGGNSIQFALKGAKVIAIDLNPIRLKCARHNAKVYGVEDRIEFICADFFHVASTWTSGSAHPHIDAVFLSPPWGGPSYLNSKEFLLDKGLTPDGFDIFTAARAMSPNIAYFLPRHTSIKQLRSLCSPGGRLEIEQSCLNKKIKTITAYYGELACTSQ